MIAETSSLVGFIVDTGIGKLGGSILTTKQAALEKYHLSTSLNIYKDWIVLCPSIIKPKKIITQPRHFKIEPPMAEMFLYCMVTI